MVAPVKHRHHEMIPKDLAGNLSWRIAVTKRMAKDPAFAASIQQMCSEDILFWINGFVWTYDPRLKTRKKVPMITYEFQNSMILELVEAIESGSDLLIEKSRDMGVSWVCLLVLLWFCIYRELCSFVVGSRTQDYVDKTGNPKCLFWKFDFVVKHLAPRLRPRIDRTRNNMTFLDTGSILDGEATNDDFASGDRRTAIFLDEFAKVPNGQGTWTSTRDVTDCRLVNSTHKGTGTTYYEVSKTEIRKIRAHWSQHPKKARGLYTVMAGVYVPLDLDYWRDRPNWKAEMSRYDETIRARGVPLPDGKRRSPWYALQCKRAAHAVEIAQELDIDVLGSSYQFFTPDKIEEYIKLNCFPPFRVGEVEFDFETLEPIGWRDDPNGAMKLWMLLDDRGFPLVSLVDLGCDISAGTGASNSAISGISRVNFEKVLEYANPNIRPEAFGRLAVAVANWLGGAKMIWEQNGPGRQFGDAVIDGGYRNVFYRTDEEKVSKLMSDKPGWVPTPGNKLAVLGEYRRALELGVLTNHSELSLRDSLEYVYLPTGVVEHSKSQSSSDPTGARSNHGDRTIADALAWKLAKGKTPASKRKPPPPVAFPKLSPEWRRKQALRGKGDRRRLSMWTR